MNEEAQARSNSSLITPRSSFLARPAGPEGVEPAVGRVLLVDYVFEFARVEPDAAAVVAAVYAHLVVGVLVELARAARAVHRDRPHAARARVLAYRLAEPLQRLLVPPPEVLLFEAPPALVENVSHVSLLLGLRAARRRARDDGVYLCGLCNSRKPRRRATRSLRRAPLLQ